MDAPTHFEQAETHAVFRPAGVMTLVKAVNLVTDAISHVRASGMSRLMVVLTGVAGVTSPGLTTRYEFIREWARASGGMVKLVLVIHEEMIDPDRFGVTVAANAGMVTGVFAEEAEALEWLLGG